MSIFRPHDIIKVTHGTVDGLPAALRVIGGELLHPFGLSEGFRAEMRVPQAYRQACQPERPCAVQDPSYGKDPTGAMSSVRDADQLVVASVVHCWFEAICPWAPSSPARFFGPPQDRGHSFQSDRDEGFQAFKM